MSMTPLEAKVAIAQAAAAAAAAVVTEKNFTSSTIAQGTAAVAAAVYDTLIVRLEQRIK